MNPQEIFCPNLDCPARGQVGAGNISVHSQKEQRYGCEVCGTTLAASQGTIFYRLKTEAQVVIIVLTLLAHGCPLQAIVAAYGFDERTIKSWWQRAGQHCQKVHEHTVGQSQLDLQQVQADEIKVKIQGGTVWMALAMMVSTRLGLGGVISPHRDKGLIQALADQIRRVALCRPLLLAVDGLPSYVKAFQRAFRSKVPRLGQPGRCHLWSWPDIAIVQVVKQRAAATLTIQRRLVQGSADLVERLIQASQGQGGINTAYIERLNATFRQSLAALARRTRGLARTPHRLETELFWSGAVYNFCTIHTSLAATPAVAAGLTEQTWSIEQLLRYGGPSSSLHAIL